MRVLQVLMSTHPTMGGLIESVLRLNDALRPLGVSTEIACLDRSDADWIGRVADPVHPLGSGPAPFRFSRGFAGWIKENRDRYDVVVVNGIWNYSSFGTWLGLHGGRTPYVAFTHGMLDPWFREAYPRKHALKQLYWRACEGRVLRDAKYVLFTSDEERRVADSSLYRERGHDRVVAFGTADAPPPGPALTQALQEAVPGLGGKPFLLFLGRLHPKKGCDLLIPAFAAVSELWPDLHLVVAGPDETGIEAELKVLARSHGMADRVHFPGMLLGNAKWGALRGAEALCLPSHQENFGVVVAESMACERPVLISDKVNIWREVLDSEAGFVGPDTLEGTIATLRSFLSLTAEERERLRARARACFDARFDISVTATDFHNVLTQVAARQ